MADSVLYFPMIRPPESAWFARVLLYWDKVGTMMPAQYSEDHAFLQPYTSALVREGLLTVVPPDESVWRSGATNYFDAFLALVDSDPFGVRQEPANEREWASVHVDKTGLGLAMALEDRGLAERYQGAEYAAWVQVEHHTADLLMAFLASIVGKDPNVVMDPITDSEASMAAFTTLPEQDRQINAELEPIRSALLDDVLPGPTSEIDFGKLAKFKAKHRELLLSFRRCVEREAVGCAQIDDPRLRTRQVEIAHATLADQVREIEGRMSERRLGPVTRGTIGVVAASLTVADLVVTGGSTLALTSGGLGLASATDAAFQGTRRQDILKNPLAYAALAQRQFA